MSHTIRRIGASRLATVSECQTPTGQHVALKEFNRQPLSPLQKRRIFEAAQRWKTLHLAGLVPYLEVSAGDQSITMELFDRSAAIRLREGPSDPRLVLHTLRGILAALIPLHAQELVHGNLKPTNVFFDTTGRTRLSDGLLTVPAPSADLPPPINLKYIAPELANPDYGPLTSASDVYCLGLLALELLAGDKFARAFPGMRQDVNDEDAAWSQWHGSSQLAPHASVFAKDCPEALAKVVARMVAKQPQLRYADAQQVLQDLPQDIAGQIPATAAPRAAAAGNQTDFFAAHIIPRPATGVVLAIASGSRAGEMIGSNENELMLGFDHDCVVRFSYEQHPAGGSKVLLRRGSQGWYALRVSGQTAFVNQRALEEKCPLRSGDIVRLSSRGPDVQFTMQSGGVAIAALVERFLPAPAPAPAPGPGPRPLRPQVAGNLPSAGEPGASPRPGSVHAADSVGRHMVRLDPRTWKANSRKVALGISGVMIIWLVASFLLRVAPMLSRPVADEYEPSAAEVVAPAVGSAGLSPAQPSPPLPANRVLQSTAP